MLKAIHQLDFPSRGKVSRMKVLVCILFSVWFSGPVFSQERARSPVVDVEHYQIDVEVEPETSFLQGEAVIQLRVLEEVSALPFELNNHVNLIEVVDEQDVRYSSKFDDFDSEHVRIVGPVSFQPETRMKLVFRFEGTLEKEEYIYLDSPETQMAVVHPKGALLLTEGKWFPSHLLPLDGATAEVKVTVPLGFTAVAPGILQGVETLGMKEVFHWKSDQPLTGIPVVVGQYLRQEFEEGSLPLTFFVKEVYDRDLKPLADEVSEIVKFFSEEYGQAPISELTLLQLGDIELPSTGCSGLILLDSTIMDREPLEVMELAQRVAHQWWGYSVRFQVSGDAWLQEGFSTYAALRYVEKSRPEEFSSQLAKEAIEALKHEKKAPISRGLSLEAGTSEYRSIVRSKGAWVLYMLRRLVGEKKFDPLLREWYLENAHRSTTTSEFVRFVKESSGEDYGWFFAQWVDSIGIPEFRVEYVIFKVREGGFKIRGQILQDLDLFRMPTEITIETKGEAENRQLMLRGKSTSFTFNTESMPLRLKVDPDGKILMDSEGRRIGVQVALGDDYRRKGEFTSAIRAYEKARSIDLRSSIAHFRLGEVFFEQHNYSSAANSFRDALNGDLKPEWVETWTHIYLGKIYDVLGERQRALAEYQKAINSKIDYKGAQLEARKYKKTPYSKPKSLLGAA